MDFMTSGGNSLGTWKVYDTRTVNNGDLPDLHGHIEWNRVNWIANHENDDWKITQAAIWKLSMVHVSVTQLPTIATAFGYASGYSHAAFPRVLDRGPGSGRLVPTYGAVLCSALIKEDAKVQPMAVRVYIPPNEVPEFPTLALPGRNAGWYHWCS